MYERRDAGRHNGFATSSPIVQPASEPAAAEKMLTRVAPDRIAHRDWNLGLYRPNEV